MNSKNWRRASTAISYTVAPFCLYGVPATVSAHGGWGNTTGEDWFSGVGLALAFLWLVGASSLSLFLGKELSPNTRVLLALSTFGVNFLLSALIYFQANFIGIFGIFFLIGWFLLTAVLPLLLISIFRTMTR